MKNNETVTTNDKSSNRTDGVDPKKYRLNIDTKTTKIYTGSINKRTKICRPTQTQTIASYNALTQ